MSPEESARSAFPGVFQAAKISELKTLSPTMATANSRAMVKQTLTARLQLLLHLCPIAVMKRMVNLLSLGRFSMMSTLIC